MSLAFGARINWVKSYSLQAYLECNAPEYDQMVLVDYKDEYTKLIESELLQRLSL